MYQLKIISAAQRDCGHLDPQIFKQVQKKIEELSQNPRPFGCIKLSGEEGYRLRSGDWRILYRIDDKEKIVFIYRVKHRKEAYR